MLLELGEEEDDGSLASEAETALKELHKQISDMELQVMLSGPYDGSTAKVGLLFEAGQYRVNTLGANVPVGP